MEDRKKWTARWIWAPGEGPSDGNELVCFRHSFRLEGEGPYRMTVDVSADSRYRLYVNGHSVCAGPCRGDLNTYYYETVEIGSLLRPGSNVIAARVLHYRHGAPRPEGAIAAHTGGLLLEGAAFAASGAAVASVATDETWLCLRDPAVTWLPETVSCVGGTERVDGARLPHGWELPGEQPAGRWSQAVAVAETARPYDGLLAPWLLAPRPIPLPFERERLFARAMRWGRGARSDEGVRLAADRGAVHDGNMARGGESVRQAADREAAGDGGGARLAAGEVVTVAAGETFVCELDAGMLTTGYIRLQVAGGRGGAVRFLCAESYTAPDGGKGVRDDFAGKSLQGYTEAYLPAGSGTEAEPEIYETLLYRTFRFVRVEAEAAGEPLVLMRFDYRETGYPLETRARFACSDPTLEALWPVSLNTLQRCMHDTYIDCPYYEQLQYSMDTRLQILFTYAASGDDRLARKAIYDFHSSLLPSGMLQSRYPSVTRQVIPGFALYWVQMVYDHWLHFGDIALAKRYRPTIDAVLDWFEREVGPDGLVGAAPERYWSYVDWVREWEARRGVPDTEGPLTVYNLLYADALTKAAALNEATGRPDTAAEYRTRSTRTLAAVHAACRSEETGLYRDGPGLEQYSQHAQIWAILSGAAEGEQAVRLAEALLADASLAQVSYSMSFFLFRALAATGLYAQSYPLWDAWKAQLKLHLTSWLEDPVTQRSDCHAWGCVPLYDFMAEILGVKPAAPGSAAIVIAPQPGPLRWARGSAAVRERTVAVDWTIEGDVFTLRVTGLAGLPAQAVLPDGKVHECAGDGGTFVCRMPAG